MIGCSMEAVSSRPLPQFLITAQQQSFCTDTFSKYLDVNSENARHAQKYNSVAGQLSLRGFTVIFI